MSRNTMQLIVRENDLPTEREREREKEREEEEEKEERVNYKFTICFTRT